ncbi:FliM/FliN family flagellar motor switch protein [Roseivivax sp. CAU 1753]
MDVQVAAKNDVLRRKASVGRRAFEAQGMSPERALNRALTRAAETQWNLALLARDVRQLRLDQAGCEAALGEGGLILLLEGPNGTPGFALIDGALVAGLTEVQTFGTITNAAPEDRPFTSTDAAMMAPLLDQGLTNFARLLAGHSLGAQVADHRFGALIDAARVAGTLMDAAYYTVFRMQIELGGGRRVGQMVLAFAEREDEDADSDSAETEAPPRHSQAMLRLPVRLDAVLCRLTMSLCDVEALGVGTVLKLPRDALTSAELCAAGGLCIAEGTLGQMNGQRALRLKGEPSEAWSEGPNAPQATGPAALAEATGMPGPAPASAPTGSFQQIMNEVPATGPEAPTPSPLVDLPDIPELDDLPDLADLPPIDLEQGFPHDPLGLPAQD